MKSGSLNASTKATELLAQAEALMESLALEPDVKRRLELLARWRAEWKAASAALENERRESTQEIESLSQLLDAQPALLSSLDKDFNYRYVNAAYERWHGISREKILGTNIRDFLPPAVYALSKPLLQKSLEGEAIQTEGKLPSQGGQGFRHVVVDHLPRKDKTGAIIGVMVGVRDITERVEREDRFREVYELSPLGIIRLDEQYRILGANRSFQEIVGFSEAELEGVSPNSFTHPEDREIFNPQAGDIESEQGIIKRFQKRYVHHSGKIIWAQVVIRSYRDLNGKAYCLAIVEDITALKEAWQESEVVFETVSEGLVIQNPDHTLHKFNPAALNILHLTGEGLADPGRYSAERSYYKSDGSLYTLEDWPASIAMRTNKPCLEAQMGFYLPNGEMRWIQANAVPFESGGARRVAISFTDVTAMIRANEEIKHIFHHTSDLICISGADGYFKRINPSFSKLLGFSDEELLARPFVDFVHPLDRESTLREIGQLVLGQDTIKFENRFLTKSGETIRISWNGKPDPKTGLFYVSGRDITKERAAEMHRHAVLRALNKAAIVGYTNSQGYFTDVNENFCALSGYTRQELLGESHRLVDTGLSHSKMVKGEIWNTIRGGQPWTGDLEMRQKSGETSFVRTVITPLRGEGGAIEQYMSIRFDVTAQKNLERLLVEAQGLAKIGSWAYSLDSRPMMWTAEHFRIYEIDESTPRDQLVSLAEARVHPEDLAGLKQAIAAGGEFSHEFRLSFDGKQRIKYVRVMGRMLENEGGQATGFSGTCQDITEQKRQEHELRSALDVNQTIVRSTRFAIITTDLHGLINGYNDEAEQLLGYTAEEVLGKITPAQFHDHDEVTAAAAELTKELGRPVSEAESLILKASAGEYDERQWTFIRKDGGRRQVRLAVTGLFDAGGALTGYMGISRDISQVVELRRMVEIERARSTHHAKLASLGEMSAGIAHEINNPLGVISGNLPLLKKFRDNEAKFDAKLESLTKASDRIEKIVKGLKKFSRSSEGSVHQQENVASILAEALILTEAKSRRHSTPVHICAEEGLQILCDSVEIEQVVVNLINNGIDAVKALEVRWIRIESLYDRGQVVLRVTDSGSGISREIEAKLFEPFFTTKRVGEGTGLGLSIAKGILDQHHATFVLDRSSPYTCFEIRFPLAAVMGAVG